MEPQTTRSRTAAVSLIKDALALVLVHLPLHERVQFVTQVSTFNVTQQRTIFQSIVITARYRAGWATFFQRFPGAVHCTTITILDSAHDCSTEVLSHLHHLRSCNGHFHPAHIVSPHRIRSLSMTAGDALTALVPVASRFEQLESLTVPTGSSVHDVLEVKSNRLHHLGNVRGTVLPHLSSVFPFLQSLDAYFCDSDLVPDFHGSHGITHVTVHVDELEQQTAQRVVDRVGHWFPNVERVTVYYNHQQCLLGDREGHLYVAVAL